MQEIWKDIPGFNGKYRISNFGNVMSVNYLNTGVNQLLAAKKHHTGYLVVVLSLGSRTSKKTCTVHSLVAKNFIPNPDNKPCVNHIDGNKENNRVDNLEWVTYKENTRHAIETGLRDPHKNNHPHGENTVNSRSVVQYTKDGKYVRTWGCISDAARFINAKPASIVNNAKGRTKSVKGYIWRYDNHSFKQP